MKAAPCKGLLRTRSSGVNGVADGSRTRYLRSHNPVLYLVSYSHHQEAQTESLPHSPEGYSPSLWHNRKEMVGVEGFEPPTSCSQSRRATRLRYTPKTGGSAPARRAVYRHCELSAMRNKTSSPVDQSLKESRPFLQGDFT